MQTITAWLESHGFQVGSTKGRTVLEFSGSASQVHEAFHTTIHKYIVNSEQHWANSSDPSIPTALTPAVAGVLTLHNFLKKPQIRIAKEPVRAKIRPGKSPELTLSSGVHAISPEDFATIYNVNPIYRGNNFGTFATIAVVGRSNLYNGTQAGQDVLNFRQDFNAGSGNFLITLNGPDPGDLGGAEEAEATLDATWSGVIGYGATVNFVVSASTNTSDGIDLSEVYIIENDLGSEMTESFSGCEALSTSTQAIGASALAEQAATQGITYFVSAGDNGAEGCDDQDTETVAGGPVSVNLLASTPFTVAVGGTVFNENGDPSLYWSSTNTNQESAISYIPEDAWNDSCPASTCGSKANIVAGSGGASTFFSKPSWQAGVTGIPNDNSRDLPDVSLTASGAHDGYVLCLEGSCVPNAQGEILIYLVGGTSASAPSFASLMALVAEQAAYPNFRLGLANYVLYRLAATQNATLSQCNASSTSGLPGSSCIFNDVTVGNNAVPGEVNYGLSTSQYQAGVGYDLATGLGSVNVTNLVNQWDSVTFNPTIRTLSLTPPNIIPHGSAVNFTITVSPSSGSGIPTGDVSLIAGGQNVGTVTSYPLNNGTVTQSTTQFPGGISDVQAYYAGDATYAPSYSANTFIVNVTPEPSTTTLSVLTFTASGTQLNFTGGPFGSFVYLRADVAGLSGHGTPTGSVTFTDTFGPIPGGSVYNLNGGDQVNNGSYTATPNGVVFDTGSHTISASYSGDASFNPSNSTQSLSFTIQPGFFAAVPSNKSIVTISAPGSSGASSVSVTSSTGFSGTISLSCSALPASASCQFSPSSITAAGTLTTTSSTITVTTMAATALLRTPSHLYLAHWLAAGSFAFFSIVLVGGSRKRWPLQVLVPLLMLVALVPACGGGGGNSNSGPPPNPSTPAGTYNVVVTASSGSLTSTTGFTLVLK
jgi:subtilase family serine protease